MKKQFLAISLILSILILNAFHEPQQTTDLIHIAYINDMVVFENGIKNLKYQSEKYPLSISDLKTAFKQARLDYKKVAWLIGYLEPDNEKNFNGAPLPKVEMIGFTEIPPLGFQPIEEIIFGEDIENELPKLRQLILDLQFYTERWTAQMKSQTLSDREIFEAFRSELTQMFTQSFTGFDSPIATHSLPEAFAAWSSLESNIQYYLKNLEKKDVSLRNSMSNLLSTGKTYLINNQEFNTFDRLFFLRLT